MKRATSFVVFAALIVTPAIALAQQSASARAAAAATERDRPHTMAELSTGLLTLPAAEVCPSSLNECNRGEASLALGLASIFRYERFGVGGSLRWATTLRNDAAPGAEALERDHSRRYFLAQALGRYYFHRSPSIEWWTGPSFGIVIINDSWSTKADRKPYADTAFVGPRAATIGTEGFSLGLAVGFAWNFATNWAFGTQLRYENWLLPGQRDFLPTHDQASLSGRLDTLDFGLSIAYRIAL